MAGSRTTVGGEDVDHEQMNSSRNETGRGAHERTDLGFVGLMPGRYDIDDGDKLVPLVVHPDAVRFESVDPDFIQVFG